MSEDYKIIILAVITLLLILRFMSGLALPPEKPCIPIVIPIPRNQ
ncbi:MAG: hypothetical protein QME35_07905 [Thermoanaerobacteraceae bacterium]|nr:hypothetical protein [Thermoanaerobacteraceae bacterium]